MDETSTAKNLFRFLGILAQPFRSKEKSSSKLYFSGTPSILIPAKIKVLEFSDDFLSMKVNAYRLKECKPVILNPHSR